MPSIEDYLQPLHEGIWEVMIPRSQVTEPLGEGWVPSQINIPTPGTIASYRKGQYHMHVTRTDLRVHLDRYDPKIHPMLHLIDDAPLLLMISETFITLISFTRHSYIRSTVGRLQEQNKVLRHHMILGPIIIFLGVLFIIIPELTFYGITNLVIPGIVIIAGLLTLKNGISLQPFRIVDRNDILSGTWMLGVAILLVYLSPQFWVTVFLVFLAGWMFASSVMLLRRVLKGRKAVPEGFISRMLIGIISLLIGIFSLITPLAVLMIFLDILGVLTMTIGIVITLTGVKLRALMKPTE
jgi:uncharacterized membrane protein HdeD (DUF308 family)